MSIEGVSSSHQVAQAAAVSNAQAAQKQVRQQTAIPQDRVTISAAAQGQQTASAIGADPARKLGSRGKARPSAWSKHCRTGSFSHERPMVSRSALISRRMLLASCATSASPWMWKSIS